MDLVRNIVHLSQQQKTDLSGQSLAMALYFASRGIGTIRGSPDAPAEAYESTARVLLNGLGSDELLGGYGRHRTAFNLGWQAVIDEVIRPPYSVP
jgi:asparagine synthetase B (glutamine-hydrolysing)